MRWPFGAPHLTLKPSKKKHKKQKKYKEKKEKKKPKKGKQRKKKTQKYQKKKELFSYQSIFSFLVGVRNSLFGNLAKKSTHPKNTIQIGVSATHFLENSFESRNGHFWTKTTKSRNSSYHFSFAFFFPFNNKNTKMSWNPYFIVF